MGILEDQKNQIRQLLADGKVHAHNEIGEYLNSHGCKYGKKKAGNICDLMPDVIRAGPGLYKLSDHIRDDGSYMDSALGRKSFVKHGDVVENPNKQRFGEANGKRRKYPGKYT